MQENCYKKPKLMCLLCHSQIFLCEVWSWFDLHVGTYIAIRNIQTIAIPYELRHNQYKIKKSNVLRTYSTVIIACVSRNLFNSLS